MSSVFSRRRLLAAGAGLAMALALPGPAIWPLVFLVPGLLARALADSRGWRAFRAGWLAGFVQWAFAVAWVVIVLHRYGHLPLPFALLGWLLMAAIMGLTWGAAGWAGAHLPAAWRLWALPVFLVAMELLQRLPPWIFPWNPAAALATAAPALMLPLPVVGAAGLSLLIYLTGAGLDRLATRDGRKAGIAALAAAAAIFGLAAAVAPRFRPSGPAIKVAALQPNVPLEVRWDADNLASIEEKVWRLTDEARRAGAGWIVWPESAVPRLVERDPHYRAGLERWARRHGAWLLLGSIGLGAAPDEYYNSVFAVSPGGLAPWRYDKVNLVPFGEYVPLAGRVAALRALVREVGSFTPGRSALPLPGPAGPTGVAICYEVAFPALVAAEVELGATVLTTITNDGWYGDSAAPRQHLALAILRAAETRRYLVRAANTGISAVIDPYGRVVERLEFGREGFIAADVVPGAGITPAVRFGAWLRGAIGLLAVLLFAAGRRQSWPIRGSRTPGRGNNA
ncbi:MAG: apolipoprotein N-acyltransferase [Acidobacteriota bacterium]